MLKRQVKKNRLCGAVFPASLRLRLRLSASHRKHWREGHGIELYLSMQRYFYLITGKAHEVMGGDWQNGRRKKTAFAGRFFELQLAAEARSVSRGYTGVIAP